MTTPPLKACAVIAVLLALTPSGHAQPAHKAHAARKAAPARTSAHTWQPTAALLKQLAPEASLIDYGIRPPQGYELEQAPSDHDNFTLVSYHWTGEKRPDQTQPTFTVLIFSPKPGYHPINGEEILNKLQKQVEDKLNGYIQSPTENGTVHDVPFTRTYWKGTDAKTQQHAHGFTYFAVDSFTGILITADDAEPHSSSTLPLLEAAAETFHRL